MDNITKNNNNNNKLFIQGLLTLISFISCVTKAIFYGQAGALKFFRGFAAFCHVISVIFIHYNLNVISVINFYLSYSYCNFS